MCADSGEARDAAPITADAKVRDEQQQAQAPDASAQSRGFTGFNVDDYVDADSDRESDVPVKESTRPTRKALLGTVAAAAMADTLRSPPTSDERQVRLGTRDANGASAYCNDALGVHLCQAQRADQRSAWDDDNDVGGPGMEWEGSYTPPASPDAGRRARHASSTARGAALGVAATRRASDVPEPRHKESRVAPVDAPVDGGDTTRSEEGSGAGASGSDDSAHFVQHRDEDDVMFVTCSLQRLLPPAPVRQLAYDEDHYMFQ